MWPFRKKPDGVSAAIDKLIDDGSGLPLLKLIVSGEVSWISLGNKAYAITDRISVENDMYFYMYVSRGMSKYNVDMLTNSEMASMLTCAAVNKSKISKAVDDYTTYLEKIGQ